MPVKHKVLKDFQLLTDEKKILILKSKTILEDYKFKNKSEIVKVSPEVIKNNADYFQLIDWKEELQNFLKTNKIPQPAIITKKLLPFIENLLEELPTTTKEIIIEKPVTIEKEVYINNPIKSDDTEYETKLRKVELLQKKLENELVETNNIEAEYIAKKTKLDQLENSLKKQEHKLENLSKDLNEKDSKLNDKENLIQTQLEQINSFVKKDEIIEVLNSLKLDVPHQFQGYFGNSLQSEAVSDWYKELVASVIQKIEQSDIM